MADTKVIYGMDSNCVSDLKQHLNRVFSFGYDFASIPLVHPRNRRIQYDPRGVHKRTTPLTRSDTVLRSEEWINSIVGKISPWIELDSSIELVRKNSEIAFQEEICWASHLGIPSLLLPAPKFNSVNYSNFINYAISVLSYCTLWITVPLREEDGEESWEFWNSLRTLCDHHPRLAVALEFSTNLPSEEILNRWLGEPVRTIIVPTSLYQNDGFLSLPVRHQSFIQKIMRYPPIHFIVSGNHELHLTSENSYQEYLRNLQNTLPPLSPEEQFSFGYNDYLQSPLQPLMDNLESQTYETFEKDPVKYTNYEEAVYQALMERFQKTTEIPVIMVVGAGRGPLVKHSLAAALRAKKKVKVYAVEKNKNAIITLQNLVVDEWGESVTVVSSDMREWKAPQKADIIVSELLGSFGDNELSPECLDPTNGFLKDSGISIPCDYTSFISPISSSKLYNEVRNFNDDKQFETPFVVKIHNYWLMSEIKPLFSFHHPNHQTDGNGVIDNSRFLSVEFDINVSGMMHGIAGFFESRLYKEVFISIHPETHSKGMFSWFPIFFPLKTPMYIQAGSKLRVNFWRKVGAKKVWYEWSISSPRASPIHNSNGKSYWIGL